LTVNPINDKPADAKTPPQLVLGGIFLWTLFMNLARGIGQLHGRMAKSMLVADSV
jgi:hypothetical protein